MKLFNKIVLSITLIAIVSCNKEADFQQDDKSIQDRKLSAQITSCHPNIFEVTGLKGTSLKYEDRGNGLMYNLDYKGNTHRSALKGNPTVSERAWISPGGLDGQPAIAIEAKPCSQSDCKGSTTQKSQIYFFREGLKFDEKRTYISFNMLVGGQDLPADGSANNLVLQVWQGSPHSPPFMAFMEPNPTSGYCNIVFKVNYNSLGTSPSSQVREIGRINNVKFDDWFQYKIGFYPEHEAMDHLPGNQTITIDYKRNNEVTYKRISYSGKWGYDPTGSIGCPYANNCEVKNPNPNLYFLYGIYRASGANIRTYTKFTNFKGSTALSQADPKVYCN